MKEQLRLAALLLAIALPAGAATLWSAARQVTVVTTEYKFTPAQLSFRRGVAYRLHLENHGKDTHEFTAPAFFKASEIRNPSVLNADHTEIVLPPGAVKDLYFIARQAGRFDLRCSDHDWAGMTGAITVR